MSKETEGSSRRSFLSRAALATAATTANAEPQAVPQPSVPAHARENNRLVFPRTFSGRALKMIAFPLGGVAAGSISLGGRGNLRDWEIFNRADKGNNLSYALPSIWAASNGKTIARVLEARFQPPFEGQDGLGSDNAPGLSRFASATFIGNYPLAKIDFEDSDLPVRVSLEAFSPFIPHEPDDSGLPVAVLRYRVTNPAPHPARVSIAWSIENPVQPFTRGGEDKVDTRKNEFRSLSNISGLLMTNPPLPQTNTFQGSFALVAKTQPDAELTYLRGWPKGRWWNSPLLFWDDFSSDGKLGPEAGKVNSVGAICISQNIPSGKSAQYEFLLAWHFPNRTPARCGWKAPAGEENTIIGNWYCTRFENAWAAAEYAATHLEDLERRTRQFASALHGSTLPAAILDAASANLSTLTSTTCFRTADGEFHAFEGVDDKLGCCFGNCTHVWNYETATAHLFPIFARSLRKSSFGFSMDDAGAMHFRQLLPDGKERSGFAAADGQMGQIVHAYLDWILSGDRAWLENLWPRLKKAIAFAWIPGGWDGNQDGVLEGVQHNTYDVEFYGPNPQCSVYYLAALRACEEMARTVGDEAFAAKCRRLFDSGSRWIDANLFNGEYFVQQVEGYRNDQIAPSLRGPMGAEDPEHPEFQIGKGCLADQLIGQYLADVCGLGPLLNQDHIQKTLASIYKYNYKRSLSTHDSVQRTYVLNDEAALVVCDYGAAPRPRIPFPYFAEAWTGLEYSTAAHMMFNGLTQQGIECITSVRRRYDGERRNPWDEPECGHHYARAMASWSCLLALSGFHYHGGDSSLSISPPSSLSPFKCFWSTATAWGTFTRVQNSARTQVTILVSSGSLHIANCRIGTSLRPRTRRVLHGNSEVRHRMNTGPVFQLEERLTVDQGQQISFEVAS
jgi:non-lysosomal glucosylceramidase